MATYLQLVNKVINESASELDELTALTWSTAEAGRRQYPRFKRNVADAWKTIQMERNEWEFKTHELSTIVYPRLKVQDGLRAAGAPTAGDIFVGDDSTFQFTVRDVITNAGDWTLGTAEALIEFDDYTGSRLIPGETFTETLLGGGSFTYLEKGSYQFTEVVPGLVEILWETFVGAQSGSTVAPIVYIPWDNWTYQELSFTQGSTSIPAFVSQDFQGNVVFYPQSLEPFRVDFIYNNEPQALVDDDDVPEALQAQYHDWIAWRALMYVAKFDKNPELFTYARDMETFYKLRAERNLMPIVSWGASRYGTSE